MWPKPIRVESSQLDVPEAKAEPPPTRVHRLRRLFFWESFTSSAVMLSHNLWPPCHYPKVKRRLTTELTQAAWKPSFPLGNQPEQTQFVRQFPLSGLSLFSVFLGNYYPTWLCLILWLLGPEEREKHDCFYGNWTVIQFMISVVFKELLVARCV